MNEKKVVVAIVGDGTEEELWDRDLKALPGVVRVRAGENLERSLAGIRRRGISPAVAIVSSRLYPGSRNLVQLLKRLFPVVEVLLVASADLPLPHLHPLAADGVRHLVIRPASPAVPGAGQLAPAVNNLLCGRPWQMGDYLLPGTPVHEFLVRSSDEKEELIAAVTALVEGGAPERELLRQKGALLADEMLENALYGAPCTGSGEKLFSKGETRLLLPAEQILFRFGFDGETLALEVADSWGSLADGAVVAHLARNHGAHSFSGEIGGRGFFIIWQFLDQMHVNIVPGRQTVVGGHVRLDSPFDSPAPKEFHITVQQ